MCNLLRLTQRWGLQEFFYGTANCHHIWLTNVPFYAWKLLTRRPSRALGGLYNPISMGKGHNEAYNQERVFFYRNDNCHRIRLANALFYAWNLLLRRPSRAPGGLHGPIKRERAAMRLTIKNVFYFYRNDNCYLINWQMHCFMHEIYSQDGLLGPWEAYITLSAWERATMRLTIKDVCYLRNCDRYHIRPTNALFYAWNLLSRRPSRALGGLHNLISMG